MQNTDMTFLTEWGKLNIRVAGLIQNKNRMLFYRHKDDKGGKYLLIGGRMQIGERSDMAFIREMKEELGIDVAAGQAKLSFSCECPSEIIAGTNYHELLFVYRLDVDDGILPADSFDCKDCSEQIMEWVDIDKLSGIDLRPKFILDYIGKQNGQHLIIDG